MYFEYMNIINNAVYYICDYAYTARNLVLEYLDMLYSLYLIKFGGDMGLTSIDIGWSSESMFDITSFGKFYIYPNHLAFNHSFDNFNFQVENL